MSGLERVEEDTEDQQSNLHDSHKLGVFQSCGEVWFDVLIRAHGKGFGVRICEEPRAVFQHGSHTRVVCCGRKRRRECKREV